MSMAGKALWRVQHELLTSLLIAIEILHTHACVGINNVLVVVTLLVRIAVFGLET